MAKESKFFGFWCPWLPLAKWYSIILHSRVSLLVGGSTPTKIYWMQNKHKSPNNVHIFCWAESPTYNTPASFIDYIIWQTNIHLVLFLRILVYSLYVLDLRRYKVYSSLNNIARPDSLLKTLLPFYRYLFL